MAYAMYVDLWKPALENEIIFDHTPPPWDRFNFFVQNQEFFPESLILKIDGKLKVNLKKFDLKIKLKVKIFSEKKQNFIQWTRFRAAQKYLTDRKSWSNWAW